LRLSIGVASGLLALQLALGLGAVGGLGALVLASQLLANGGTLGLGGRASGVAAGRLAHGLALGAVVLLALVFGATDGADGLLAMDGALGARYLLALHLALGALAHRVANCGAGGVIALPFADGVALQDRARASHKSVERRQQHCRHDKQPQNVGTTARKREVVKRAKPKQEGIAIASIVPHANIC